MPAPSTAAELLELIRKSGVVEETRLSPHLDTLRDRGACPEEPGKLAKQLVEDGYLTFFQAEQFLQGKWKRFNIGKYKVLERLGSGGMGQVFLCEHKLMRRRVAVKVLPGAKAEDPSALERFYREARAVAALDHPNLVRAFDIDEDDGLHFLVMEYVDGASLQEIVKKTSVLDPIRACHYAHQAAIGLDYAYNVAQLIHRDIKPGNILVDRTGTVKILDMGLARFFNDEEDILTKKYDESVLGTADYLAPEQAIDSHNVDIRADIYSLGATFYFMLTGRAPFPDGTVAQKLIKHQSEEPKPIRELRPEVPPEIVLVVETMMRKQPDERYQTPSELAEALAPFTRQPIPPPSDEEMPHLSPAAQANPLAGPSTGRVMVSKPPQPGSGRMAQPMSPTGLKAPPRATPNPSPSRVVAGAYGKPTPDTPVPGISPTPSAMKVDAPAAAAPPPGPPPDYNPFANLNAQNPHGMLGISTVKAVYAQSQSGPLTIPPAVSRSSLSPGRMWLVLGALGIAAAAAGGVAAWLLTLAAK